MCFLRPVNLRGSITQQIAVLNFTTMKISKYHLQPDSCLNVLTLHMQKHYLFHCDFRLIRLITLCYIET